MTTPRVGSATWQDASYRTINVAHALHRRPFTAIGNRQKLKSAEFESRSTSRQCIAPPPFHRDLMAQTCNAVALTYMRDARASMYRLRAALLETNRHIQRLHKERDILEKAHANVRKDIVTNQETVQIRNLRPKSEKYPDKVDTSLREEQKSLLDEKKHSENQLHEVSRQLKALYVNRQKLSEFCKERSRVLDLVGETSKPPAVGQEMPENNNHLWQDKTAYWAVINQAQATCKMFRNTQPPNWQKQADLREMKEGITGALRTKASESSRIREDLTLTLGDSRNFIQKEQRIHDEVEQSYNLQLGPLASTDLTLRESLTRPLVKILQRHPVTQLPESTYTAEGSASLQKTLDRTRQKIRIAQFTQQQLKNDSECKLSGQRLDQAAARLRDRSAKKRQ
ncbi:Hypothetical predicted protein [Pelobates cultripes]|uniref:Uncharacterized protein n=1 Tax=Pelobates cultripes TaxID=61616 RepID=A0AAD1T0R7_PELCU|nr:Hypothetical predicted protein [Pelobates cultripes]